MTLSLPWRIASGLALGLSLLVLALWLAWQALVPVDFGYGIAYQWLDIEQHVQKFAPQNRYRQGFADTSAEQRKALFSAIVHAIQHEGEGLRTLFYTSADGRRHPLLRDAEVLHLQDVARLVRLFDWSALVSALLLAGVMATLKMRRLAPPSLPQMLAGLGVLLAVVALVLVIAGPTTVFYWLHTRIFPPEHPWFFYYQDSLMTTLMKAPDLFGFIAALWSLLALLILTAGYLGLTRWLKAGTPPPPTPRRRGSVTTRG